MRVVSILIVPKKKIHITVKKTVILSQILAMMTSFVREPIICKHLKFVENPFIEAWHTWNYCYVIGKCRFRPWTTVMINIFRLVSKVDRVKNMSFLISLFLTCHIKCLIIQKLNMWSRWVFYDLLITSDNISIQNLSLLDVTDLEKLNSEKCDVFFWITRYKRSWI